jgi:hypothetical protein
MSSIEVSTIKRDIARHELFSTFVSVQSLEPVWDKFPPCVMVKETVPNLHNIRDFRVHADDVFLCGFPRSGATIMQEIIWLLVNDCDFGTARIVATNERFPFLESLKDANIFHDGKVIIYADEMKKPRTIKTHLPVQFLPDELYRMRPKIVYLRRDVKDVAISAYHYIVDGLQSYAKLQEFLQDFLDDKIVYTPYWEHLVNFGAMPDYGDNLLEIEYEWMVEHVDEAIWRVAKFLGREVSKENFEIMKKVIDESSKRKRAEISKRCEMPAEFVKKFDEFIERAKEVRSEFENM